MGFCIFFDGFLKGSPPITFLGAALGAGSANQTMTGVSATPANPNTRR
jgi:hypothetical protein